MPIEIAGLLVSERDDSFLGSQKRASDVFLFSWGD